MSTSYSERCPNCGKLLYYSTVERSKSFGNSIQKCPSCQHEYFDNKVFEWVNLTNEEKKSVLVFGTNMTVVRESEVISIYKKIKFTKYLLLGIPLVRKFKRQVEMLRDFRYNEEMLLDDKIQESIRRTSNKEYIAVLVKHGRNYYGTEYSDT